MSIILDFIPEYKKLQNRACIATFKTYGDVIEAQINCNKDKHCSAIYLDRCGPKGDFSLCYNDGFEVKVGSCSFQKGTLPYITVSLQK